MMKVKREKLEKIWAHIWPYLLAILVTSIMILPQLHANVMTVRGDTFFHYSRFYDIYMQLKTGHFNYFQSNFGFQQSGRIINALYGPGFALINGIILCLAHTWFNFQIITDYLLTLLAMATMMYLLKYLKVNKLIAVFLSLVYINIGLIPTYINSSSFNSWGQALMPLVLLCGIRMIKDQEKPINWFQLALVMGVLAQVHVLSTLLAVLLLIPFFFISIIKIKDRRKILIPLAKAIGAFLLLTANIWGAFLEVYSSNIITSADKGNMMYNSIMFDAYHGYRGTYGNVFGKIMPILLILIIVQLIYVLFRIRKDFVNFFVTIFAVGILAFASIYFPWGFVQNHFVFLAKNIQFPFRFVAIAYPMLIVGFGITCSEIINKQVKFNKIVYFIPLVLLAESLVANVLTNQTYVKMYSQDAQSQKYYHSSNLQLGFLTRNYGNNPEYLPTTKLGQKIDGHKIAKIYIKNVTKRKDLFNYTVLPHGRLKLSWNSKNRGAILLPIIVYSHSQLILNGKKINNVNKNVIGNPKVNQKQGKNYLILTYHPMKFWYVAIIISILSWLISLFWLLQKKFSNFKLKSKA